MSDRYQSFQVPLTTHLLSGFVQRCPRFWRWLGDLETSSLQAELAQVSIERPVYISGLARAGTTLLLEFLARHPQTATHRYRDFPGQFVPHWWNAAQPQAAGDNRPCERAHGDGLEVTLDSPEAMEESLWMAFFPTAHDVHVSNVLDATTHHPKFEEFYRDHLRKLLLVRGASRYVAKGNYNMTRQQYLLKQFPDARLVVAIRHPRNHVASLMKQHRLFCEGERRYPRALAQMRRVGHFEFGLDRRPINTGDTPGTLAIERLWRAGDEVRGLARYWAQLYGWLADQRESDRQLSEALQIVQYEQLCEHPAAVLQNLLAHCNLEDASLVEPFAATVQAPTYYEPDFSAEEDAILAEETSAVAARFGYGCQAVKESGSDNTLVRAREP